MAMPMYGGMYYAGDPCATNVGAGHPGACAAGTCSGGVASGGCGGPGGCGSGGGCGAGAVSCIGTVIIPASYHLLFSHQRRYVVTVFYSGDLTSNTHYACFQVSIRLTRLRKSLTLPCPSLEDLLVEAAEGEEGEEAVVVVVVVVLVELGL